MKKRTRLKPVTIENIEELTGEEAVAMSLFITFAVMAITSRVVVLKSLAGFPTTKKRRKKRAYKGD